MLSGTDHICPIKAAEFDALNAQSWQANAGLWSAGGGATPMRKAMLARVDAVVAGELGQVEDPSLADLGCADGSYLARLNAAGYPGALQGIDLSPALISHARSVCPDARFDVADLTADAPLPISGVAIATCLLTLFEIAHYPRAISNARDALRPGGLLVVTLLDPTVEALRFLEFKRGRPGTQLYDVEGELAIGSLFEIQGQVSPAPYFRFLRPIDCYAGALLAAGFILEDVSGVQGEGFPYKLQPRAVMLCARNPTESRLGGRHGR